MKKMKKIRKTGGVRFLIPRAVLELHRFVDVDRERTSVIHIEADTTAGHWVAVATNGYQLITVTWKTEVDLPEAFSLPVKVFKDALKGAKKSDSWTAEVMGTQIFIRRGSSTYVGLIPTDVSFPPWERVITRRKNKGSEGTNRLCMDFRYLESFLTFVKKCQLPENQVIWSVPEGELDPIRLDLTEDGMDVVYILMPCRME